MLKNFLFFLFFINTISTKITDTDTRVLGPLQPPYADNADKTYKRVCVYPNWSILRESAVSRILPEDIDPNLCTHIHYAYANIDVKNLQLLASQFQDNNHGDHGAPFYTRIMKLKEANPNLKILISIGGWFAKSTPFNKILMTDATRRTFIENALNFIRHWKFDGLDVQWEYPGAVEYGATSDSKEKFTNFIRYLSRTFKDEYRKNFRKLTLSAFVASNEKRIDDGYDVELICRYLDYASVATYDYTGPSDSKTGYNAPLYSRSSENNNVNSSIHYWLDRGCPSNKLLMGIPTYARGFKVTRKPNSPSMLHLGIESEPFLNPSLYTSEEGVVSYYEVCELMKNKDTKVYWDDVSLVPFAIVNNDLAKNTPKNPSSSTWISYEDSRSARKKAEYVKQMSLGGVSLWALDMDDFKGQFCNLGPYPIIEAIKQELDRTILINPEENTEYSSLSTKNTIELTTKERLKGKNDTFDVTLSVENAGEKPMTTGKVESTTKISLTYNSTFELSNKKFHAVKHIKIIALLDKNKRQTNCSSKNTFSLALIIFYSILKPILL